MKTTITAAQVKSVSSKGIPECRGAHYDGSGNLMATDRHVAVIWSVEIEEGDLPVHLGTESFGTRSTPVSIDTRTAEVEAGPFPPVETLFAKADKRVRENPVTTVVIDLDLLARIAKAMPRDSRGTRQCLFTITGPHDSVLIEPVRDSHEGSALKRAVAMPCLHPNEPWQESETALKRNTK